MPLLVPDQRSPEWHDAHINRVTGSTAAACLRLDPNCSPQKAWRKIVGVEVEKDNPYLQHGREWEGFARLQYEQETGSVVAETGFWVHEDHDWLGASPDGLILQPVTYMDGRDYFVWDHEGGLEIKCPLQAEVPTRIPVKHQIQMLVCMEVTGAAWWDYYVWTHSKTFLKRLYRPPTLAGLVAKLAKFHAAYVEPGIEPERKRPAKRVRNSAPEGATK